LLALSVTALGVVYGDIGTSPLYALRICFSGSGIPTTPENVLGVLSLICWALTGLITVKYLLLVLRADNHGEGGILALMALVRGETNAPTPAQPKRIGVVMLLGLLGAALLYGDGLITPAISVLSAVEGLEVATPKFAHWVVPVSLLILVGLFSVQRHGTQRVGAVFGPVMLVWFLVLAVLGIRSIAHTPQVLAALNPWYAVEFMVHNRWQGFVIMGAVFLVITGGEDLYLDMGHLGRLPIRLGWFSLVLPALLLNYFGQGALLLRSPESLDSLFYRLTPHTPWALYPMVALATVATVIASQAVISGAFSLTRQATQLGFCPRTTIIHTSDETIGQVYLPAVNGILLVGTVTLVLGFQHSDNLAGAYGLAVSAAMLVTSLMLPIAMVRRWHWHPAGVVLIMLPIWAMDLLFFSSNLLKFAHGGWVGISVAVLVLTLMLTWDRGRQILARRFAGETIAVDVFVDDVATSKPLRVPGVAVFLTGNAQGIPRILLHNFKHNKVIHEKVILLTVLTESVPRVPDAERVTFKELPQGFYVMTARYGFSEDPDVPAILGRVSSPTLELDPMRITFFLGRETLIITGQRTMWRWRKHLFWFLSRNSRDASKFFRIPPNRVIEIGIQVEL